MRLTEQRLKNAKPTDKTLKLFDGGGLYLEITPKGAKLWRLKYRFAGKEKRFSLGNYPLTSLKEAREKRDDAKKLLEKNIDPSLAKQEAKHLATINSGITFELIGREWLDKRQFEIAATTWKTIKKRLENDLFRKIGKMPIKSINPPLLLSALKAIEERGVVETTKRNRQYASQIFQYAIATGRAESDPSISLVKALKSKKTEHYKAMSISELPIFLQKIDTNKVRLFRQTSLSLKLMVLTFTRKKELTHAKWDEVNFNDKQWIIPAERMKMKRPHIVPLSRQSLAILEELKAINGEWEYIFTGQVATNKPMNPDTPLRALYTLGYQDEATIHGFRAMAMTAILEDLGYRFEVVDAQLAHAKRGSLGDAYDRAQYLKERIPMMQDWADYVDSLKVAKLKAA